jgi:hypothetical protein
MAVHGAKRGFSNEPSGWLCAQGPSKSSIRELDISQHTVTAKMQCKPSGTSLRFGWERLSGGIRYVTILLCLCGSKRITLARFDTTMNH